MIEDETKYLKLPLPHKDNFLSADVERLRQALEMIDSVIGEKLGVTGSSNLLDAQ